MKKVLIFSALFIGLTTIQYAEAKGGGSSKSSGGRTYARDSHGRFASTNTYSGSGGSSSYSGDSDSGGSGYQSSGSSYSTSSVSSTIHHGVTKKRAGLRTCESKHCKVVTYLPKGSKVQWSETKDGFIHIYDSPYWISPMDVKK